MGMGTETRSGLKSLDPEQVSTQRLHEAETSWIRWLSKFEAHVRSEGPDVQDYSARRKKRAEVQAKQLKYTKGKNEGKSIIQTELDTSEV